MVETVYNTTATNSISNVRDWDSYLTFMGHAWLQYADLIMVLLVCGAICGIMLTAHLHKRYNNKGSDIT